MKFIVPAAIAIGVGIVVLLGYFIPLDVLAQVRGVLVGWAVVLGGLAVLIGLLNLVVVHFRRMQTGARGSAYSLLTVAAAIATFVIGSLESVRTGSPMLYAPGSFSNLLFADVIAASQAALAGLVMIFLVVGAVRLLRGKLNQWSIVFLVSLLIVLVGWIPLSFLAPVNQARDWFMSVPVAAGARGILLGVALGAILVGLRVIVGIERPYKD